MWNMPLKERWCLYRRWVYNASESCYEKISDWQETFDKKATDLKEVKLKEDYEVLKKADVIGMTTTGNMAFILEQGRLLLFSVQKSDLEFWAT